MFNIHKLGQLAAGPAKSSSAPAPGATAPVVLAGEPLPHRATVELASRCRGRPGRGGTDLPSSVGPGRAAGDLAERAEMARRYDSRTTTFSPEGRLYQVEYALEAINNASSTLGILAKDGVVLAADKAVVSKLLDQETEKEKIFRIDDHVICAAGGWTADANILIGHARLISQRFLFTFDEPQPVEQLIIRVCDTKQSYTQFGGLRPFGVSFLVAGWDRHFGFQLYHTDPAGNYSGWKATAIGQNNQSAQAILRQQWKEEMSVAEAKLLAAKVLIKTMDTATPSAERLEFAVVTLDSGAAVQKMLSAGEIAALLEAALEEQKQQQKEST